MKSSVEEEHILVVVIFRLKDLPEATSWPFIHRPRRSPKEGPYSPDGSLPVTASQLFFFFTVLSRVSE
jgi:hypothetical protein